MAHPYSTEARLRAMAAGRSERLLSLLDRDEDGAADDDTESPPSTLLADTFERAANIIDGKLVKRYGSRVPFAAITDTPTATPGLIADICDELAAGLLYRWLDPKAKEAVAHTKAGMDMLAELASGEMGLPGVEEPTDETSADGVLFESIGTYIAGGTTDGVGGAPYNDRTRDDSRF